MGIKLCPQCSGKVSDSRNDCPHCNYIFPKLKKCPDCEEEIDDSLSECPICGHIFEKETSKEVAPTIQAPQHNDGPNCPYCDSTESMPAGTDVYLCTVCKNKFMDTRGLPSPPVYSKKTANNPAPVPAKEEKPDDATAVASKTKKNIAIIWLWISLGFTIFSYLINMILALCIGGFLRWMFDYILAGYIAGFICMGIGLIVFIISLISHLKNKETKSKKPCIIAAILMVCLLCITFAPLLSYDGFKYYKNPNGTYVITDYKGKIGTEFEIPEAYNGTPITKIYSTVFEGCTELTDITISRNISYIDGYTFRYCTSLANIEVDDNNPYYKDIDGNLYSKDGTVLIKYASGKTETSFTVPNSVTTIESFAFYNCSNLTSITIPNDITIYSGAFYGCQIEEATIPASACDDINNPKLEKLTITCGSTIYSYELKGCTSLKSLIISNSVTSIGGGAFEGCTNITSITCPALALDDIPKTSLETVVITSGDIIYSYALTDCTNLSSVVIGDSVRVIESSAFKGCTNLSSVVIGDSVTSIGHEAFEHCTSLTSINYNGTIAEWNSISKGPSWAYNVNATVYCTDGNIRI